MAIIDMTIEGNRKRVAVLVAIGRLRVETETKLKFRGRSTLQAMQSWGFVSKRKVAMLAELKAWLAEDSERRNAK